METNGVVLHDQTKLVVKLGVTYQVVVRSDETERASREGGRLSRSSDGLLSILVFGDSVELLFGRNEVLFQENLASQVTEVHSSTVVASHD